MDVVDGEPDLDGIVLTGISTNHCCETTAPRALHAHVTSAPT